MRRTMSCSTAQLSRVSIVIRTCSQDSACVCIWDGWDEGVAE